MFSDVLHIHCVYLTSEKPESTSRTAQILNGWRKVKKEAGWKKFQKLLAKTEDPEYAAMVDDTKFMPNYTPY